MIRDLPRLSNGDFDLLVVGGGIYGLITAYDAAQRGLSVALIERSDFGSGTSFNHLKTIHGGLRYLQSADLPRMRESIRERRAFAKIAPRLIAPLPFIMQLTRSPARGALAMRTALTLDALVAFDRNSGIDATHQLPAGRLVSAAEGRQLLGALAPADMGPGAMWYDYQTVRSERLTIAFALAASNHGAALANYVEAVAPRRDAGGAVRGVLASDTLTGQQFDIRARVIVNAAGPWSGPFLKRCGVDAHWPLLKAMNLVTSRPAGRAALVAPTRRGRALILVPWQGRTLVGTSESSEQKAAGDHTALQQEVSEFLSEVNDTFSGLHLTAAEVTLVHRGIVPAVATRGSGLSLLGHSRILDHTAAGLPNVITLVGVKYTTARLVAERAVDRVMTKLRRPAAASRTAQVVLPGASLTDRDPDNPVAHALAEEMAQTLIDVVVRRTSLGAAEHPSMDIAAECANAMQQLLGWPDDRKRRELESLDQFYQIARQTPGPRPVNG